MALLAALRLWLCGGTRWKATSYFLNDFEFVGVFIVQDVEFRCKAVRLELGVQTGPCVGQLAGLASFGGFGKDCAAVVVI